MNVEFVKLMVFSFKYHQAKLHPREIEKGRVLLSAKELQEYCAITMTARSRNLLGGFCGTA